MDTVVYTLNDAGTHQRACLCTGGLSELVDFQGLTLLHTAVVFHSLSGVCIVLRHGGLECTTVKDRYGMAPVDRAYECWVNTRDPIQNAVLRHIVTVLIAAHVFRRVGCDDDVQHSAGLYSTSRLAVTARHHPDLQHAIITRDFPTLLLWLLLGDDDVIDASRVRPHDTEAPARVLGVSFCMRVLTAAKSARDIAWMRKVCAALVHILFIQYSRPCSLIIGIQFTTATVVLSFVLPFFAA